MDYKVFYRKYRPKTFTDVVEQSAIKATLLHQLETNTIINPKIN